MVSIVLSFLPNASRSVPRTSSLENLSLSDCAIGKRQADNLVVLWEFDLQWLSTQVFDPLGRGAPRKRRKTDILEDDEGTVDTADSVVLEMRLDPVGTGWVSWVTHCCCGLWGLRGSWVVALSRRRAASVGCSVVSVGVGR